MRMDGGSTRDVWERRGCARGKLGVREGGVAVWSRNAGGRRFHVCKQLLGHRGGNVDPRSSWVSVEMEVMRTE